MRARVFLASINACKRAESMGFTPFDAEQPIFWETTAAV
jgi:hypothetical protein